MKIHAWIILCHVLFYNHCQRAYATLSFWFIFVTDFKMTKNSKICNFNVMLFWFISCDRFHNKKWTCLLQNKLTMLFHLLKLLYTNHFTFNTHSQYCMNAFLYLFQGLCLLLLNMSLKPNIDLFYINQFNLSHTSGGISKQAVMYSRY